MNGEDKTVSELLEEGNALLFAYEFKWKREKVKIPAAFAKAYPGIPFSVLRSKNFLDFIT